MVYLECRKCHRGLQELELWGKAEWCGDQYRCKDFNHDLTRDPAVVYEEAMKLADRLWNLPPDNGQFEELFDGWD